MAALTTQQRDDTMRSLVRKMFVESNATAQLTTTEVRLLVNNLDDYLEANASEINSSIDVSIRSKATLSQKALAMAFVAMRRGGIV
jgi:hypothetical protein